MRMIHVSVDQGDTWNMAQLPAVGHEQFYSILAANGDMVFIHVDEPGGQSFSYISFRKILYTVCFYIGYMGIRKKSLFPFSQTQDTALSTCPMTVALSTPNPSNATSTPPQEEKPTSQMSLHSAESSSPVFWLKVVVRILKWRTVKIRKLPSGRFEFDCQANTGTSFCCFPPPCDTIVLVKVTWVVNLLCMLKTSVPLPPATCRCSMICQIHAVPVFCVL